MANYPGMTLLSADVADAINAGRFTYPRVTVSVEHDPLDDGPEAVYRVFVHPLGSHSPRLAFFETTDVSEISAAEGSVAAMNADLKLSWLQLAADHFYRRFERSLADAKAAHARAHLALAQRTHVEKLFAPTSDEPAGDGIDLMRELGFSDEDALAARARVAAGEASDKHVVAALIAYGYTEHDLHGDPGVRMRAALNAAVEHGLQLAPGAAVNCALPDEAIVGE